MNNRGQLLVEAIVAISIIIIGTMGVLGFLYRSLSLNRVISDEFTGTYLAAEGIEIAKNILDSNRNRGLEWNSGFASGAYEADYQSLSLEVNQNRNIRFDSSAGLYDYENGTPISFTRTIVVATPNPSDANELQVNSIVKWKTRGGGNFEVNLEDHFFNWQP